MREAVGAAVTHTPEIDQLTRHYGGRVTRPNVFSSPGDTLNMLGV